MRMIPFGRTGLEISELCLGTMTWGTHTPTDDAHRQIDMSLEAGINIIDTAEMYPVAPVLAETAGRSEQVLGEWVAKSGRRDQALIATKVSGAGLAAVRDGAPISGETIRGAVEKSLRHLQTDYIDLYQLHWPNRGSYHFRQNWSFDPAQQSSDEIQAHMIEVLETLKDLQDQGKIRHFGLSNESAWGTMRWLSLAAEGHGPRVAAMQNEYSLLCRLYDTDMSEVGVHEDIALLAYSPLAAGYLTGKYAGNAVPEKSRKSHVPEMGGRETPRVHQAVAAYAEVAQKHGLDLVQMALAWCQHRPFPVSAIFGATNCEQLERILGAADMTLSQDVLSDLDKTHHAHPMPY